MLETVNGGAWKIVEKGVAIIEIGRDKGVGKKFSRICVKRGSDLMKLVNLVKGYSTNIRDVLDIDEGKVKFNTKVACKTAWRN